MSFESDQTANEANIKMNERLNGDAPIPRKGGSVEETNMKIQEAFYGDHDEEREIAPTYLYNNTAAVKVTGKSK